MTFRDLRILEGIEGDLLLWCKLLKGAVFDQDLRVRNLNIQEKLINKIGITDVRGFSPH